MQKKIKTLTHKKKKKKIKKPKARFQQNEG